MEKRDLVDYIKREHDRLRSEARDSGFTKWALIGAAFYFGNAAVTQFDVLQKNDLLNSRLYLLITLASAFGVGVSVVHSSLIPSVRGFVRDVRIKTEKSFEARLRELIEFVFLFVVPLLLHAAYLWAAREQFVDPLTPRLKFGLWTSTVFFSVIAIFQIWWAIALERPGVSANGKLPDPEVIHTTSSRSNEPTPIWDAAFLLISYLPFIGSVVALSDVLIPLSEKTNEQAQFAFLVLLCVGCLLVLFKSYAISEKIVFYRTLERDIAIRDMPIEEIRERLDAELLGLEFGSWLTRKLSSANGASDQAMFFWTNAHQRLEEIKLVQADYALERNGRLNKLEEERAKVWGRFQEECITLRDWLSRLQVAKRDMMPAVIGLVANAKENLDKIISENEGKNVELVHSIGAARIL